MRVKKVIAIILCLVMVVGNFSAVFADTTATNVDFEGHWAQTTIQKWIDEGRISGYPDGSFKPNANITRAEFVKLVNGLIDYDTKGNVSFNDVKTGDWFYDVVSVANEIGYISGYSNTKFGPNDNITREQAAAILSRIQYLGENADVAKNFSDNTKISSWALGTVGAASEAGFINGYENGSFKPLNNLTRAEAVTMLDNVLMNAKNKVITKAGTELNNYVVEGDLIIAKTVGEGDVHLDNVSVTGTLYIYGGGVNSLYFNNLKVAKIVVDKDKVRLVLGDGTVVEEIAVGSETVLQNDDGTVSKITITSDNKVTLSGSFDTVTVMGKSTVVLKDAKIQNLVAEKAINILGTGTIATLTANADGVQYDSTLKVTKTVAGEGVTEKPAIISSGGGGGGTGGGDVVTPKTYGIAVTAKAVDGQLSSNITFTTEVYKNTDKISDFLVAQTKSVLSGGTKNATIESYFDKIIPRLQKLEIGSTSVYTQAGFDKSISYLAGTSVYDGLKGLKSDILDDDISISDINAVLALYDSTKVAADSATIKSNLESYPFDTQTVAYDGSVVTVPYTITYGTTIVSTNEEVANLVLNNILFSTMTVEEFFTKFGDKITISSTVGSKTATVTIEKVELQ